MSRLTFTTLPLLLALSPALAQEVEVIPPEQEAPDVEVIPADETEATGTEAIPAEAEAEAAPAEAEASDATATADEAEAAPPEAEAPRDEAPSEDVAASGAAADDLGEAPAAAQAPREPGLPEPSTEWTGFHGDLSADKYSPVTSFTPETVDQLEVAWELHTGDVSDGSGDLPATVWSATPIFANDTLYLGTPFYRIFAVDPATGDVRWTYDSQSTLEALTQPALKNRGVAYWESGEDGVCEKRVYLGTMDAELHAVDADTGELCTDFGDGGIVNVNQWNDVNDVFPFSLLQPPTVVGDQLFLGWAGKDWEYAVAPPGNVLALDVRTGELNWELSIIPEEIVQRTGTANVWTAMSADPGLGLLYLPVSSPSPNYWGGNRTEEIPLATSVTAVDMETGEVAWSRQLVHHDIWDYDTNAAPTLIDIQKDGETIPALVQTTKQGMLYVLDRRTGEPVFGMEEREVPTVDGIEGEVYAPTQPFVTAPEPLLSTTEMPEVSVIADILSGGTCSEERETYLYEGLYTPPSLQGSFVYPGTAGGMQWGGGSYDRESNIFYVNTSHVVQTLRLIPRDEYEELGQGNGPGGGGLAEQGYYPQEGAPYGFQLTNWLNWLGMPCWEPPYGTLRAYDMTDGSELWEVPLGLSQRWGWYGPESWGSPTIGGSAVTAGGVLFIGSTMDGFVRAFDAATGEELWRDLVDAPSVANPAVYSYEGRDYVVFVAGGNSILKAQVGDQVVAYALPEE